MRTLQGRSWYLGQIQPDSQFQYFSISYKGAQKLEKPFFTLLKFAHLNFFVIGKLPLRIHNLQI